MSEDERPKRSWSEIDRMRDGAVPRDEREPKGRAAQARSREATGAYLKKLDRTLFAKGGGSGDDLANALVEARGSADFDTQCRAYLDEVGPPTEPALIAAMLDARDGAIRVDALRALAHLIDTGVEPDRALRGRVRGLADDFDDALAEAAEDVLAKLSK